MAVKRKKWPWVLGGIFTVLAVAYGVFLAAGAAPTGDWTFDLAEARRLADSMPGSKPSEIRVEKIADFEFPHAVTRAGDGWSMVPMAAFSYQLVFPTETAVVDTALTSVDGMPASKLDSAALARMNDALSHASMITVTHEHMDHLGGLVNHPKATELMKVAKLNREQISHPELLSPSKFPPGALTGFKPLPDVPMQAVMPGVVIVRAPGHTPGSQMVYVKRADGQEVLLLGDVAWREENVLSTRERPRLMAKMIGEDRGLVQRQLVQLAALRVSSPEVHQVPGHDPGAVSALVDKGLLTRGFVAGH